MCARHQAGGGVLEAAEGRVDRMDMIAGDGPVGDRGTQDGENDEGRGRKDVKRPDQGGASSCRDQQGRDQGKAQIEPSVPNPRQAEEMPSGLLVPGQGIQDHTPEQEFGEHDGHQAQGETPAILDGSADQEGETDGDGYDEERQRQHLEDRVLVHKR